MGGFRWRLTLTWNVKCYVIQGVIHAINRAMELRWTWWDAKTKIVPEMEVSAQVPRKSHRLSVYVYQGTVPGNHYSYIYIYVRTRYEFICSFVWKRLQKRRRKGGEGTCLHAIYNKHEWSTSEVLSVKHAVVHSIHINSIRLRAAYRESNPNCC